MGDSQPPPSQRTMVVTPKQDGPKANQLRAVLTTASASETARVLLLPEFGVITLGRSSNATFRFDEASVSSTHARIAQVHGVYMFSDNNSTNGSFLNDVRVTSPMPLADGDRLRLGPNYQLRFSMVDPDEEQALKRLHEGALMDALTRVFNRKHLEDRLDVEVAFAIRHKSDLTLIIMDIDFFKKVNDTYGHQGGDAVLVNTAEVVQKGLRTEDMLARYGGEEFVILSRGIPLGGGCAMAERLRVAVQEAVVNFGGQDIKVTTSMGVASLNTCVGDKKDKTTLLSIADARLYAAKQGGRNRVVGWT